MKSLPLYETVPATVREHAERAIAMLEAEGKLPRNFTARDANGVSVKFDDPSAVQICLMGAVCRAAGQEWQSTPLTRNMDRIMKGKSLINFLRRSGHNDYGLHLIDCESSGNGGGVIRIYLVIDDRGVPCCKVDGQTAMAYFRRRDAECALANSSLKHLVKIARVEVDPSILLRQRRSRKSK